MYLRLALVTILVLIAFTLPSNTAKPIDNEVSRVSKVPTLSNALEAPSFAQYATLSKIAIKVAPVAPKQATGCNTGNPYKDFIYHHESGCRTDAINPIGACGLGQALPCSKMPCGLSDYECQDRWFTDYALERYGSWEAAYNYWKLNSWW